MKNRKSSKVYFDSRKRRRRRWKKKKKLKFVWKTVNFFSLFFPSFSSPFLPFFETKNWLDVCITSEREKEREKEEGAAGNRNNRKKKKKWSKRGKTEACAEEKCLQFVHSNSFMFENVQFLSISFFERRKTFFGFINRKKKTKINRLKFYK